MNQYLENLKNTQGKKSPCKSPSKRISDPLSPSISNIRMKLLNQSPAQIQIKQEKFEFTDSPKQVELNTEDNDDDDDDGDDDEVHYLTNTDLQHLNNSNTNRILPEDSDKSLPESSHGEEEEEDELSDNYEIIVNYLSVSFS